MLGSQNNGQGSVDLASETVANNNAVVGVTGTSPISVDNTDPTNPVISFMGTLASIYAYGLTHTPLVANTLAGSFWDLKFQDDGSIFADQHAAAGEPDQHPWLGVWRRMNSGVQISAALMANLVTKYDFYDGSNYQGGQYEQHWIVDGGGGAHMFGSERWQFDRPVVAGGYEPLLEDRAPSPYVQWELKNRLGDTTTWNANADGKLFRTAIFPNPSSESLPYTFFSTPINMWGNDVGFKPFPNGPMLSFTSVGVGKGASVASMWGGFVYDANDDPEEGRGHIEWWVKSNAGGGAELAYSVYEDHVDFEGDINVVGDVQAATFNGSPLPTGGITQLTSDVTAGPGSGSVAATIAANAVTNAKLRDSGALSVIGRSANSTGDPADISATAATDAVLRESGSVLGFGAVATGGIADNAVTNGKLRDGGALSVIGRSANSTGDPGDISATAATDAVLRESGSVLGFGTVATGGIANSAVTNAKRADMADSTVSGRAVGAGTGAPTDLSSAQLAAIAALGGAGRIDVQTFTATGAGTWTKPTSFTPKKVCVYMIGAGAGGGSGRRGAAGSARGGGGGGGSGGSCWMEYAADQLGATEALVNGAPGTGAAAISANDTNGGAGNNAVDSSFGTGSGILMTLTHPTGGGGGTTAGGGAGASGGQTGRGVYIGTPITWVTGSSGGAGGVAGGSAGAGSNGGFSGDYQVGTGGGGGGGAGITSGNATSAGAAGGLGPDITNTRTSAGTAGTGASNGGAGGDATANTYQCGGGGGGGGSNGAGVTGGRGGRYGGGGGGGAATVNGTNSGAGGDGFAGIIIVISTG